MVDRMNHHRQEERGHSQSEHDDSESGKNEAHSTRECGCSSGHGVKEVKIMMSHLIGN